MHQPVELPDEPQIRFVRMKTGDDLITEIVETKVNDQDCYLFVNPLKIVYIVGEEPGRLMLSLIEWVFPRITKVQQFQIYPEDVVTVANTSDDINDYYFEALYKLEQKANVKLDDPMMNDAKTASKIMKEMFNQTDDQERPMVPTEEEVEYIKKVLDDLKNVKRTLH